jgi:hypothetical protein
LEGLYWDRRPNRPNRTDVVIITKIDSGVGTVTVTGAGGFASSGNTGGSVESGLNTNLRLGSTILGVADEIYLAVRPLSANADIDGGLGWREIS